MYRFRIIVLVCFFTLFHACFNMCEAVVTVTPASGLCLNNSPGAYTAIGNIAILEGANADIAVQAGATLILSAPAGFEFLAGTGTVSVSMARNITTAPPPTIAVTATTITITFSCTGTNKTDRITIGGIQARGLIAGSSGSILRTGGTAVINGDAVVDGINHGSLTSLGTGVLVTSVADGNWSSGATWSSGSVPSCGQDILISHNVTADVAGTNGNLTVASGGNLIASNPITVSGTFSITGTGIYTHNNTSDASATIFSGSESFSATSSLIINQWYDLNVPLGSLVSSTFGDITFNVAGTWQQDGYFAPSKILGNIIINAGTVVLDDGTGLSTAITLQDVTINSTGNLIACEGTNRNFTFVTDNFTDNGTGATQTVIMNSCSGTLSWTANGDVTLNDDFGLILSSGSPAGVTMNVAGDLDITGGNIDFMQSTNAPFTLTVSGRTTISGTPGYVSLVNSGSGALIYNSASLEITASGTFELINGSFSGTNLFNISSDLIINGASTIVYMVNISGYNQDVNLVTGRDIIVTDGDFYVANTSGIVNTDCGRHFTMTGSTCEVNGQTRVSNAVLTDITVSGTFTITNGTYYHTKGEGNILLTVGETLLIDNGNFYGLSHTVAPSPASAVFNFQDFSFQGGIAKFFDLKTSTVTTVIVNCTNNFEITWESNSDLVELVSYDGNNDASLDFTVGGNFSITGSYASAYFLSSKAGGNEAVSITGNFSVGGGNAYFVCDNSSTSGVDAHNIIMDIGGNIDVSGGITFLSARDGTAAVTVGGDVIISGGILNLKWLAGVATMTVAGGYTQTGGTFNIHSHTAATSDTCKVTINGDFSQTSGIFNFDNAAGTGMAEHTLTLNGGNFTIGGTATITHVNNLTTNYVFGQLYFNRSGTTTYSRTASTHNIQHVKQTIQAWTTVDASSSAFGFQMTSIASGAAATHTGLTVNGTIDMGDKILSSRQQANYYSRVIVNSGARYRTSHTGGLYSGSAILPSSIDGFISALNRVNYFLNANSTVEYYGTATSVVTGIPNGIATGTDHRYGILEINFTGTAGSTWVYPETTDEVYIRTSLILTEGEFNLDNDHVTANGGRAINLVAGATTSRTNGFIRSETEDGSGVVKWDITSNSSNTIPFGYDASGYIPFTFQQTSGSAGIVQIGTYRTIPDNTPYPPTVTHTRDVNGIENSSETVDRFWNITVPGTASANLTFTYVPSEGTGIISPRAQQWEPVTMGWFPPAGVQSNLTVNSTTASGLSSFNTWWTLSSLASPLPIELVTFEVQKSDGKTDISWVTQTEINNDYFTIERSADGLAFEPIRIIDGAGTSTSPLNYRVTDNRPMSGRNYYRLKQTDFDGRFTYSETKSVSFEASGSFSVFPNPAATDSDITISSPETGSNTVRIADITGRLIFEKTIVVNDRETIKVTPAEIGLCQGIYSLTVTCENTSYSQKLIIRK